MCRVLCLFCCYQVARRYKYTFIMLNFDGSGGFWSHCWGSECCKQCVGGVRLRVVHHQPEHTNHILKELSLICAKLIKWKSHTYYSLFASALRNKTLKGFSQFPVPSTTLPLAERTPLLSCCGPSPKSVRISRPGRILQSASNQTHDASCRSNPNAQSIWSDSLNTCTQSRLVEGERVLEEAGWAPGWGVRLLTYKVFHD